MNLITQTEIIESVRVDDHFSVNNITDDTIQKSELYLASTFLGDDFYNALIESKTGTGTFGNSNFQNFFDKYLKRLIGEYVLFMTVDESVLRVANNGLNNENQIAALKYVKESLKDEIERSKAMANAFLKNNKNDFPLYKENRETTTKETAKKGAFFGFVRESEIDDIFQNPQNLNDFLT